MTEVRVNLNRKKIKDRIIETLAHNIFNCMNTEIIDAAKLQFSDGVRICQGIGVDILAQLSKMTGGNMDNSPNFVKVDLKNELIKEAIYKTIYGAVFMAGEKQLLTHNSHKEKALAVCDYAADCVLFKIDILGR